MLSSNIKGHDVTLTSKESEKYFKKAQEHCRNADNALSQDERDIKGIQEDYENAIKSFKMAKNTDDRPLQKQADQGLRDTYFKIAQFFEEIDYIENAQHYYELAEKQGHLSAKKMAEALRIFTPSVSSPVATSTTTAVRDPGTTEILAQLLQKAMKDDPKGAQVEKLRRLCLGVITEYENSRSERTMPNALQEILPLAVLNDSEIHERLLKALVGATFHGDVLQSVTMMDALANFIQKSPSELLNSKRVSEDLVQILNLLNTRLVDLMNLSLKGKRQAVLGVISRLVDALADIESLSYNLHSNLLQNLRDLAQQESNNLSLSFQALYASQALLRIPHNASQKKLAFTAALNAGMALAQLATAVKNFDLVKVAEAFKTACECVQSAQDLIDQAQGLKNSLEGAGSVISALSNAFSQGQNALQVIIPPLHRWYVALRCAQLYIQTNDFVGLEKFLRSAQCAKARREVPFVFGLSQVLREALDKHSDEEVRYGIIKLLTRIYCQPDRKVWANHQAIDDLIVEALLYAGEDFDVQVREQAKNSLSRDFDVFFQRYKQSEPLISATSLYTVANLRWLRKKAFEKTLHIPSSPNSSNTYNRLLDLGRNPRQMIASDPFPTRLLKASKRRPSVIELLNQTLSDLNVSSPTQSLSPSGNTHSKDKVESPVSSPSNNSVDSGAMSNNYMPKASSSDYRAKVKIDDSVSNSASSNPAELHRLGCESFQKEDYLLAEKYFDKAAKLGHSEAQFNLGNCYYNGHGVAQDFSMAIHWYREAANQGYLDAQNMLGNCFLKGKTGVPKDTREAFSWFSKAAEKGHRAAQFNLAGCYQRGDGVSPDGDKAAEWYEKAMHQGHLEAEFYLAMGFEKGKEAGFKRQDIDRAIALYKGLYKKVCETGKDAEEQKEKSELKEQIVIRFEKLKQRGHVKSSVSIGDWAAPTFTPSFDTSSSSSSSASNYMATKTDYKPRKLH